MFVTVAQTRLFLAAIGLAAAVVLVLDLARLADHSPSSPSTASYVGTPRNTPGSTAHFRVAYRSAIRVAQ